MTAAYRFYRHYLLLIGLALSLWAVPARADRFVRMQTSAGTVDMQLFDWAAPASVDNFMSYVNNGAYDSSWFHRFLHSGNDEDGYTPHVLQGGGYTYDEENGYGLVPNYGEMAPEKLLPDIPGSIAMANNTVTQSNQFYFNLTNNTNAFNYNYTVFGRVNQASWINLWNMASPPAVDQMEYFQDYYPDAWQAMGEVPEHDPQPGDSVEDKLCRIFSATELFLLPGDATADGQVDQADAAVLLDNWGWDSWAATQFDGDFNFDGKVDLSDASILLENWTGSQPAPAIIPEPTTLCLLSLAGLGLLRRPRAK